MEEENLDDIKVEDLKSKYQKIKKQNHNLRIKCGQYKWRQIEKYPITDKEYTPSYPNDGELYIVKTKFGIYVGKWDNSKGNFVVSDNFKIHCYSCIKYCLLPKDEEEK